MSAVGWLGRDPCSTAKKRSTIAPTLTAAPVAQQDANWIKSSNPWLVAGAEFQDNLHWFAITRFKIIAHLLLHFIQLSRRIPHSPRRKIRPIHTYTLNVSSSRPTLVLRPPTAFYGAAPDGRKPGVGKGFVSTADQEPSWARCGYLGRGHFTPLNDNMARRSGGVGHADASPERTA